MWRVSLCSGTTWNETFSAENLSFQSIFKATYRDDVSLKDNMAWKDDFFYNNVQENINFVFESKIKEKKATKREGYTPVLKCTSNSFVEEEHQMKKPFEGESLIGSFQESGLPEFMKGFWRNDNKIFEVDGVGPFPNDVSKQNSSVSDQ